MKHNFQATALSPNKEDGENCNFNYASPAAHILSPSCFLHDQYSPKISEGLTHRPCLSPRILKSPSIPLTRSHSMGNLNAICGSVFSPQPPPPEPPLDNPVESPSPVPNDICPSRKKDSILIIPSSSSSPAKYDHYSPNRSASKGKAPMSMASPSATPLNSPSNSIGSDIDMLLQKDSLHLLPLTIHKPHHSSSPVISPNSAKNITVRRKNNKGSRHFRGRGGSRSLNYQESSLIDIPILNYSESGPYWIILNPGLLEQNCPRRIQMMTILSINIRGLGADPKFVALKDLFSSSPYRLILLQETMHDRQNTISFFRRMLPYTFRRMLPSLYMEWPLRWTSCIMGSQVDIC